MRQPMSLISQGLVAAAILAAGAGLWIAREPVAAAVSGIFSTGTDASKKPRRRRGRRGGTVPVVVAQVSEGRNDLEFAGIGTARARRHVTLYSAVAGEVIEVHMGAGDRVEKGAKLFGLDTRQAKLAVEMARSKLQIANRRLGRADQLHRRRVQSKAQVQDARTAADQARVELKTAQVALADHTIKAPFAGIVGIAGVDVGDRITRSTTLVTLDDRSQLTVEFDVPEQYLPRLKRSMQVNVRTPGFPNQTFVGEIDGIDSRVHPTRRTVVVRAAVDNKKDMLRPGMSFEVNLQIAGKIYPRIPGLALQFKQGGNYVWLIADKKAKRVPVEIVRRDSNTVLVSGNLKPGDPIVIEGVQRLRPDRKITIADSKRPTQKTSRPQPAAKLN